MTALISVQMSAQSFVHSVSLISPLWEGQEGTSYIWPTDQKVLDNLHKWQNLKDFTIMHSPFAANPRADALKYIFEAFRKEGMKIGCYFSKPDWHSQDYWWSSRATGSRYHNYSIGKYPERWQRYQKYVYNQIDELTTGYGPLDILWLDGGWCTPPREDIHLDDIGLWLKKNGEAIYNTVTTPVYSNSDRSVWFTANKDGKTLYCIVPKADDTPLPDVISWEGNAPKKGSTLVLLHNGKSLKWNTKDNITKVYLPSNLGNTNGIAIKYEASPL